MASITPRKNAQGVVISYQIKVSRGRDPLTGKQKTPYTKTYTPPEGWSRKAIERDLQKAAGEFEAACRRGEILTKAERKEQARRRQDEEQNMPTFGRYVESYIAGKSAIVSPNTVTNYRTIFKIAKKRFENTRLRDIAIIDLKAYFAELQKKGYSHGTVVRHHAILHCFFKNAVEDEIITENPMDKVPHPKPRKDEIKREPVFYDETQIRHIFKCLETEPLMWKAFIILGLDSGCRRGELLGLKWSAIDFKTGRCDITLNCQYSRENGGVYLCAPKNGKGRTVYLNPPAISVLAAWKIEQMTAFIKHGIKQSEFIFTQEDGSIFNPCRASSYCRSFAEKYDLPGFHCHALRHTMASLSISNGADILSVSRKLGHSKPNITLSVYSHATEEAQRRADAILASVLYEKKA